MRRLIRRVAFGLIGVLLGIESAGEIRAQGDGTPGWGGGFKVGGFIDSSPALSADGSVVYVGVITPGGAGRVWAINSDGSQKWRRELPDRVDSSPAVGADGTVYVGCVDGNLYALNKDTGGIGWAFPTGSFIFSSPAIGADGTIYIGTDDDVLYAVSPQGNKRWTFNAGAAVESPSIGADGTIYFGSWDKNVYALAPQDGREKWHFSTGAKVVTSPAIAADGTVYVTSTDQRMYALTAGGVKKWDVFTNGSISASPVLGADGTVYFASNDRNFYAVNPDGTVKWMASIGSTSASTAAVRGDGVIVFGADDGSVRALNSDRTGKWIFSTGAPDDIIESSPVVAADGSIYVGSLEGMLYRLNGNGSPLSTYSNWPMGHRDASHLGRVPVPETGGRLINLSTRAQVGGGANLIAGFVVQGTARKFFLTRGIGPALRQFGVNEPVTDPNLTLRVFNGATVAANDDWPLSSPTGASIPDTTDAVGAFPLPVGSRDSAILELLTPGPYTAMVGSRDNVPGVALVEVYDAIAPRDSDARLINLSTRGQVGTGDNILIPGLYVGGTAPLRMLVRAVGPGLTQFGVGGVLAQPTLGIFAGQQRIRSNTGWTSDGFSADIRAAADAIRAFPLAEGSADCSVLMTVNPGAYTIQIAGVGGTTGEVLVEVYLAP